MCLTDRELQLAPKPNPDSAAFWFPPAAGCRIVASSMERRVFLGWDSPFVGRAAEWLLAQQEPLAETLVMVPSSQSGRRLRRELVHRAGALLSPLMRTPGSMMEPMDETLAPDWMERLAWQEVLESPGHPSLVESLFEAAPHFEGNWAGGLADELLQLRRTLQENGLMLADAAHRLGNSPDGRRWRALAALETRVEGWLQGHERRSRSRAIADGLILPAGIRRVVMAGVTELPPVLERLLLGQAPGLQILVAAPDNMAGLFSESGIPLLDWTQQPLSWPDAPGGVHVTVDHRHQAVTARQLAAQAGTPVEQVALGCADIDSGDAIAREFTSSGWTTHHPAATPPRTGLRRWLSVWSQWLVEPSLTTAGELLSLPESSPLAEAPSAGIAMSLAELRDRWMVQHPDDLRHQLRHRRRDRISQSASEVLTVVERLEKWRTLCVEGEIHQAIIHLLDAVSPATPADPDQETEIRTWLEGARALMTSSGRTLAWWIELMLNDLPATAKPPPEGRVLDVLGWLEMLHAPGSHLILCGVNEGRLPSPSSGDPWLGESARALLGLRTDAERAARDGFLLTSICRARLGSGGRVDLICSRSSGRGEPMMPSRLLLSAEPDRLPERIRHLFRELEPPDARLRWQVDRKWSTPAHEIGEKLNATAFSDYIACPYRYFLKHVLRLHGTEPDRVEWNARDFGNIIHLALECWGRDERAKLSESADEIHDWLVQRLHEEVQSTFGPRVPLAVRIQLASAIQRLRWFAEEQAVHRSAGWEIHLVERHFKIPLGRFVVHAKADRIDRHPDSGQLLILDYKTGGRDKNAVSAHRTEWRTNSRLPAHLSEDSPLLYERDNGKGGTKTWRWQNLQLPLYVLALQQEEGLLATPGYFKLGDTRAQAELQIWEDFCDADLDAARECAEWIAGRIDAGAFWPPAEKPRYDDYEMLWCGRPAGEVLEAP